MKKFLAFLLTFVIMVSLMPLGAFTLTASAAYENTWTNTGNQALDIVEVAKTQLGYKEGSNNSNKYSSAFNAPNVEWCAYFVSWCAKEAGISNSIIQRQGIASPFSDYFNIPNTHGRKDYFPKPGDLVFYGPNSKGDHYHVGIVETVNASTGYITTIEGNTNSSGSSTGNIVYRHTRHYQYANICCYGTPNYTGATPHTCNKGEYVFYEAAHPHYKCYRCSICGEIWRNTSEPVKVSSCSSCAHTHSYTGARVYETEHPHAITQRCTDYSSCKGYIVTGEYAEVNTCSQCWYATFNISASSVDLKVGENKTISLTVGGCYPNTAKTYGRLLSGNGVVETQINNNQITFKALKSGTESYEISVYSDSSRTHLIDKIIIPISVSKATYTGKVSFDKSSISLVRPTNQSATLTIQLSGTWPEDAGYTFEYNSNIISMSQNGTELTITAKEEGKTDFIINIVSKNNNNARITYAVCSITVKNETYTIKYDTKGGTGAPADQIKTYGQAINLRGDIPKKAGYIFKGWSIFKSATTVKYMPGQKFSADIYGASDTITLYAVWEEITLVSIKTFWPDKQLYYIGESFDATGLKLRLEYSDGSTSIIDNGYTLSGFDSSTTGEKIITVSYGGKTDKFDIYVREPYVELSHMSLNMKVGEVQTIKAYTDPDDENVKWTTSDSSVATVLNGRITAIGAGTAVITVSFSYNGYNYYDTCEVTVEKDVVIGDTNDDGIINVRDYAILIQHLNGWSVEINLKSSDVNGDGNVNARDYALLIQHLNGWDVELQ